MVRGEPPERPRQRVSSADVLSRLKQIPASSTSPLAGIITFFKSNGFLLQSLKATEFTSPGLGSVRGLVAGGMQLLAANGKQRPSPAMLGWAGAEPRSSAAAKCVGCRGGSRTFFPTLGPNLLRKWPRDKRERVKLAWASWRTEDEGFSPKARAGGGTLHFPPLP